jgi:protein-disulfide isomerase
MSKRKANTTTKVDQGKRSAKVAARRQRSSRWFWVVGFLVLAVVIGIGVQALRSSSGGTLVRPAHALGPADGEVLGQASAPVTVEEYGDFQCPHCADFEQTVGPTIRRLVDQGRIRFVYHPIAFLGPESVAAANAATCAGDQGSFWPYHDLLFQQQAAQENSGFLSTDQLLRFGQQVGATDSRFTSCVTNRTYVPWVQNLTDQASQRGVNATPTILVDGTMEPDATTVGGLLAAVNAATKGKP